MPLWHVPIWEQLVRMNERLPHAILLHGPSGAGKSHFAEYFARSLLCEDRQPGLHACSACQACRWFDQYAHPDYRRILPAALEATKREHDEDSADPAEEEEEEKTASRSRGRLSQQIVIDQIRDLFQTINLSTHRGGMRVYCLWPAEALNPYASNALLKILEEPRPGTVFILTTSHIDALLPTVLSRCHKLAMPLPPFDMALDWLTGQGVADARTWLAEQGGSPLLALQAARSGSTKELDVFISAMILPDPATALGVAGQLQQIPLRTIVAWLHRWLYDLLSYRMSGQLRYFPRYSSQIGQTAARARLDELLRMIRKTAERSQVVEHPGMEPTARLHIEDLLLDYSRLFV